MSYDFGAALAVYDGALYFGGIFDASFGGGQYTGYSLLRYQGGSFAPVCCLYSQSISFGVRALTVLDRGSGPELVAAGEFNSVAKNVASWDGTTWSAFGGGVGASTHPVYSAATFDSGNGSELYVGYSGGVARWNGSAWSVIGPADHEVFSLFAYGDGSGPASLYAGGWFTTIGGVPASRIARWDGNAWSAVGTGVTAPAPSTRVNAMTSFDDHVSGGGDLYIGGNFAVVGGATSPSMAQWSGCGNLTGTAFCFGDGSLATPCPCVPPNTVPSPAAAQRHGCANSFNIDGAQIYARGSTGLDNVVLTTSGQTPVGFSIFLVGTANDAGGVASSDGVRCVDGALTRFGSQYAACGSVKYPNAAAGWNAPLSLVSGTTPGSGVSKYYQVFYRNAAPNFCTGATTNWTSGYRLDW
jgi:hypothetical protein